MEHKVTKMKEKRQKTPRPAILFGEKSVKRVGYIDNYIFACEIEGEDRITYPKPRKPKYHLVIIVIEGYIRMLYPDSPRHPRQKYLLTVKGLAAYKEIKG